MASALVTLENRSVQQRAFVIFLVVCLIESIVPEVGATALRFDGHSEVLTKNATRQSGCQESFSSSLIGISSGHRHLSRYC